MVAPRQYTTAKALRTALEARLLERAKRDNTDLGNGVQGDGRRADGIVLVHLHHGRHESHRQPIGLAGQRDVS